LDFKRLTGIALRSLGASTRGVDADRCSRSRFCRLDAEPALASATSYTQRKLRSVVAAPTRPEELMSVPMWMGAKHGRTADNRGKSTRARFSPGGVSTLTAA